jgi:NADH-quinone oxidoreductase subunit J
MNFDLVLLLFFSFTILLNSLFIVAGINSIYSIFLLVLTFVLSTGLLFLIESEFMALIFIIIYVGAISVLFLFVIIMLDLKTSDSFKKLHKLFPLNNVLVLLFFLSIVIAIINNCSINNYFNVFLFNFNINWLYKLDCITDLNLLGQILYTHYVIQFLILGMILLLAVLGAVALTFNNNKILSRNSQSTFRQVSR